MVKRLSKFIALALLIQGCSIYCMSDFRAWVASGAQAAWGQVKEHPFLAGTAVLVGAAGAGYWATRKSHTKGPKKNVESFYESQHPHARLVKEPVEWPVRAVYADNIFGRIMSRCVDFLGGYVTRREGRLKQEATRTQKYLDHYLSFYKDHIDMREYAVPQEGFATFNDWFIRTLKNPEKDRPLEAHAHAIACPADSKVLIIPNLSLHTQVTIKEQHFDVSKFLQDPELAKQYEHGTMMIFRLSPYNYHRYHYPFDCFVGPEQYITGKYHSVNPRAFVLGVKPLTENKRSYQVLTPVGDRPAVVMVQVGATAVASIVNHHMDYSGAEPCMREEFEETVVTKGSETGYFQFGGSTVVLLFAKGTIVPNQKLVENSLNGYETAVKVRETVAYWATH